MRASDATHITAAREHTVASRRRTRAHVVITHDLNAKNHTLYELFALATKVEPAVLEAVTRELAQDIIADADMLIRELRGIKAYAEQQLAKLPARLGD
jgi:hypothetical protein